MKSSALPWAIIGGFTVLGSFAIYSAFRHEPQPTPTPIASVSSTPAATPTAFATVKPTAPSSSSPTPTATASTSISSFSAPNAYPPATWRPYASTSVWNTPLTGSEQADPSSATYLATYQKQSIFQGIQTGYTDPSRDDYSHPMYYGKATDPVMTVVCNASWNKCAKNLAGRSWHVPAFAAPAQGVDHHLGALDTTNGKALHAWDVQSIKGNVITAGDAVEFDVTGPGVGTNNGDTATAADYPLDAGIIRDNEMKAGQINHALGIIMPCTSNSSVFPSVPRSSDTFCAGGAPYGARLKLNMTPAQIASGSYTRDQKTIMTALATYGGYGMDTNNNNGMGMQFESDQMYVSAGYEDSGCPTNGAPCTILTSYLHSEKDPGWTGDRYNIALPSEVASKLVFLLPPAGSLP